MMYNNNISHYTRRCMMTINTFVTHESVFLVYETIYNGDDHYHYTRRCIIIIFITII